MNGHEDASKGMIQLDQGNYEVSVRTTLYQGYHGAHCSRPKGEKGHASRPSC
jgi:hypothetical protein